MLLLVLSVFTLSTALVSAGEAETGNWTVDECIMFQMSLEFEISLNSTQTLLVPLSPEAVVDKEASVCNKESQSITLDWTDVSENGTHVGRNVTFTFQKLKQKYGVSRIYGTFQLAKFNETMKEGNSTNVTTIRSFVSLDTGHMAKPLFMVPLNTTYLCSEVHGLSFNTHLHYTYKHAPKDGDRLTNATATLGHVQLNAFRPENVKKGVFQEALDCHSQPSDVVPIIVGVVLAGVVVLVLVAYFVGRRRNRQRGYESV